MVNLLKREFIMDKSGSKGTSLPDPNPDFSPEEVLKHYIPVHPKLSNANVSGPEIDEARNKLVYSFNTSVGSKG